MRSVGISVISIALTTVVVANAYYQKKQFYPSVVYITKSNPSMAVIYLQAFICVYLTGKLMRRVFFGELRTSEFEHLMERSWYAITETCLAFTVFRDDFNPKFVALFTLLLFLKSFHWLAEDRVDFMERSPIISYIFHIRVLALLCVLGVLDLNFVEHAYQSTISKGASVQLVFGFEYAILITMVINITIKYILYSVDLNSESPWDNKAVFLLYTELIMGFIKVILYVAFVVIMVRIYTLPLFALRPMYYTLRNFKRAFNDVILSRRAIHNMNTLYPDATLEELQAGDNVCIICREEMTTAAKKLPCNHIFHASCLRSWFQRQQTCPTCRLNILRTPTQHQNEQPHRPEARVRPQVIPNIQNQFHFNMPNPFAMLNNNIHNVQQRLGQAGPVPPAAGGNQTLRAVPPNIPQFPTPGPSGNTNVPDGNAANFNPFFPFPAMPFMPPPPPPAAQNLSNYTIEQLRILEGNERENVEARIQWLKNIQLMLDASVLMLQQYNTAAAISMTMPSTPLAQPAAATTTITTENSSTNVNETPIPGPSTSGLNTSNAAATSSNETASTSSNNSNSSSVPAAVAGSSGDSASMPSTDGNNGGIPEAELRKRRLQRFQQE